MQNEVSPRKEETKVINSSQAKSTYSINELRYPLSSVIVSSGVKQQIMLQQKQDV